MLNKVEEGIQPPTGNGFPVFAYQYWHSYQNTYKDTSSRHSLTEKLIDTGLEISLSKDMTLEIEPSENIIINSWTISGMLMNSYTHARGFNDIKIPKGRILLNVSSCQRNCIDLDEKFIIGKVWIIKRQVERIRFLEMAKDGGRVIRGDSKIADSVETGSVEPGEQISNTDTE